MASLDLRRREDIAISSPLCPLHWILWRPRFPFLTFLKLMVESHEFEVLSGALRLLERARPIIWCEVDPSNAEAVSELLRSYDYRLFGADADPHPPIERAWWNTLAVPEEKAVLGEAKEQVSHSAIPPVKYKPA